MSIGLIGKKLGMTQRFFENGESLPVTILKIEKAKVVDVIDKEKEDIPLFWLVMVTSKIQN